MTEPATSGLIKALDTVVSLWDRSVALLFALFGICFVLLAAAAGAFLAGFPSYFVSFGVYPIVGGIIFGVLAVARVIERFIARTNEPSFHFISDDSQSFWHAAEEPDGKTFTQIELQFRATNMSKRSLVPSRAILKKPFVWSQPSDVIIATEDRLSGLYSRDNAIPAGYTRNVHLHLTIEKRVRKAGLGLGVKVVIEDQRGSKSVLRFKRVRFG